jgi:hypothetical protein
LEVVNMTETQDGAEGIAARCHATGGLIEAELGELREELGYRKLGKWVLAEVAESLKKARLGYFPLSRLDPAQNTEPRQWQTIWIYERDNALRSQVIDAVLNPDEHDVRAILDGLVAGHTEVLSAEQKLDRIRTLVAE